MNSVNVQNDTKPFVKIIEEPKAAVRFRYTSEERYDNILGANADKYKVTYPTIEIVNSESAAFVLVSCVTKDRPYRAHPYLLEGEDSDAGSDDGIHHFVNPSGNSKIEFPILKIRCVKVKDMYRVLTRREQLNVDPFCTGFKHKTLPMAIDKSSLRICFQVFLQGQDGKFNNVLEPVVSRPIYNKKKTSDLKIAWLSHYSAVVTGGVTMCLLCKGLVDDRVEVRFFHEKSGWEAIAEPVAPRFHRKAALIFSSPQFLTLEIDGPVEIRMQVRRLLNQEVSETIGFTMLPLETDDHGELRRKRQKCGETPKNLVARFQAGGATTKQVKIKEAASSALSAGPLSRPSSNWNFHSDASALLDETAN